jgi:hypothetical protein
MAGWLPVAQRSAKYHVPARNAAGLDPYDYMTGNLPVETPQFHVGDATGDIRDPDWVELPLPPSAQPPVAEGDAAAASSGAGSTSAQTLWWHRRYRSKRSSEPPASDTGREGAFEGEASSAPPEWLGAFDAESGFLFYCNVDGSSSWRRPTADASTGTVPRVSDYVSQWRFDPKGAKDGSAAYVNDVSGMVVPGEEAPEGCDANAMEIPADTAVPDHAPPAPGGAALEAIVRGRVLRRAYGNKTGSLRKAGGGTRLFGSKSYKPRWVAIRSARLSYFADEAAAKKLEKRKDRELHLDNYVAIVDGAKRIILEPILPRTTAAAEMGQGAAEPARSFEFEAATPEERDEWLTAMGGDPSASGEPVERLLSAAFVAAQNDKKNAKKAAKRG